MKRVLFVCTGNIFRSLTAERGLRQALHDRAEIDVTSAGTEDFPHVVTPGVRDYLLSGARCQPPSEAHVRRKPSCASLIS